MGNIETVLSSSISASYSLLLSSLQVLWYGAAAPIELFGPTTTWIVVISNKKSKQLQVKWFISNGQEFQIN
jgi:hypothetical protein